MSAAAALNTLASATASATGHTAHAAHPRPLPDRAWSLACAGHRSPAIAHLLGVPERTVRSWLAATRREVAAQLAAERADELLRAVEHLRQISVAAWDAYDESQQRDTAILAGQLDYLRSRRLLRAPASAAPPSLAEGCGAGEVNLPAETATPSFPGTPPHAAHILAETYGRPALSRQGPGLLRLALAAQSQIISLLDLPALARAVLPPDPSDAAPKDRAVDDDSPAHLLWWERDPALATPAESATATPAAPAKAAEPAAWDAETHAATPATPATPAEVPGHTAPAARPPTIPPRPAETASPPPAAISDTTSQGQRSMPPRRQRTRPAKPHTRAAARRPVLVAVPSHRSPTPTPPTPSPSSSPTVSSALKPHVSPSPSASCAHPSASSAFPVPSPSPRLVTAHRRVLESPVAAG